MSSGKWLSDQSPEIMAQKEENQRRSLEETLVKRLMADVGANPGLARREARNAGFDYATFEWFHDQYPGFPVQLSSAKIPWMHETQVGDLFGANFVKTRFFQEYEQYLAANDMDDRRIRVGIVFRWPGIQRGGGAMILHNYPVERQNIRDPDLREERGTRIVRPFGNPVVVYVIEAFQDFLVSVGTEWYMG